MQITTAIISTVVILVMLWHISMQIDSIEIKLDSLQGSVKANGEAIVEVHSDVREIRSVVSSHL